MQRMATIPTIDQESLEGLFPLLKTLVQHQALKRSKAPSPAHKVNHDPTSLINSSSRKASRSNLVNHLLPAEDGYNSIAYDREEKSNSLPTAELPGDLAASPDIFCLPYRGEVHFMLATKGVAILGYRSVDLFSSQNESLDKIIATQQDKDKLIASNILPYSHQSQEVAIVAAESVSRLSSGAKLFDKHTSQDFFHLPPLSPDSPTTNVSCLPCGKIFGINI